MHAITSNHQTRGFSLVELMVAIAISLLLLMGVVALFVSSRASYQTTERLSRIQENGRFALDQFVTDIRSAGFQGCARAMTFGTRPQDFRISTVINENAADPDMRWNFVEPARGFNATGSAWAGAITAMLDPDPNIAGDILVLRIPRREVTALQLTTKQVDPADPLTVGNINPMPLQAGDTAVISDCAARAFFQVTGYNAGAGQIAHAVVAATSPTEPPGAVHTPGNDSASLDHPFMAGAEILPIVTMVYYLAPSADDDSRMSLWRKNGGTIRSDEIAEGIDRLEIQYGVDTTNPRDGTADAYVTADLVTDWSAVLTLQIALLARAPEASGTDFDNQTYVLFSTPNVVQAGPFPDRNQRKVFTATVAVRNQIID